MKNERWITVAEYAALKGITVQAVYKQIKRKGCKLTTKVECGKTLILCDFSEEVEQPIKPESKPVVKPTKPVQQPDSTETVEFLKAEIERLHKAIEVEKQEKENLRIDMQRTIDSLIARLTDLATQSNVLAANAQNKLPDPEPEKKEPQSGENTMEVAATEVPADTDTVPVARDPELKQQPQPQINKPKSPILPKQKKQKKGFLQKLKGLLQELLS